jgi:hypothetical protein
LAGKPEGKKPLGRPMVRWEYNNRMHLKIKNRGVLIGFVWL